MNELRAARVDLVINTFERTYRRALEPGAFAAIAVANRHPFARRMLLINNVSDSADATERAQALLDTGEIDEFHFVADHIERALELTGLERGEFEPLLHYSDGPLVAAALAQSPWLLYWDPEASLEVPSDWITPALSLMERDPRVMVANPSWEPPDEHGLRPGVAHEASEMQGAFALGPGFSDQVFLARSTDLTARIYRQRCIANITYPAAHRARVFEARVAAHMRHHGRLRATSLCSTYTIDAPDGSSAYPPNGLRERARYVRNAALLRALALSPLRPACLRHSWL